ncbi:MAG: pilus assembly protein PilM [Candidatus Omnitrophota bacterium]
MFKTGIKKITPFSGIASHDLVGLDFGSYSLKFVHARSYPGKKEILNLLHRPIGGLSDEDIVKTVQASFSELKVKNPSIINVIPSHVVITKNIEIPSADPKEIREIIDLQAGRHTPYSRDEIIIDYINIGTFKHSYTKILLIIVARSVIKRQFEILTKAGLKLEKVLLGVEGLSWAASKLLRLDTKDSPSSILHIDEDFTDFTVIFKDKVLFVRNIPIGAHHIIDERERYQTRFIEEVKRSLEAYQNENIEKNPTALVLTGAVEETKTLETALLDRLHLPMRTIPYLRNVLVSENIASIPATKRVSFLNAVACLFAAEEMKVNLIPEEVKLRKLVEERGKDLIETGIFTLVIFLLIFFILISKIYFKSTYLKKLNTKFQSLSRETQKLEKDYETISFMRSYLANRGYSLNVLTELYGVAPPDLELNDIRFDGEGKFSIKGTAETMSTVFTFVDNLGKSKYFKDAKTRYTTNRKDGLKDVTDFEITAQLKKESE